MKKIVLLVAVLFTVITFSQRIQKGEKQLNAGVRFNSGNLIPIYAGLDFGVHEDITAGGELSFASKNGYSYIGVSGNANYHFGRLLETPSEWDTYAGASLGTTFYTGDYSGNSGLDFWAQLGGRYYFSNKLGLNLEFNAGQDFSGGKIGISYKF